MAALSVDGTPMPALPNSADQINYDNTTSGLSATTVKGAVDELASEKQDKTDNSLTTTNKTIVGGINELKSGLTNVDVALSVPEGTGKNILMNTKIPQSKTSDGVTLTALYDADGYWSGFSFTGTLTKPNYGFEFASYVLKAGTYTINSVLSRTDKKTAFLIYDANMEMIDNINNTSKLTSTFTISQDMTIRCYVFAYDEAGDYSGLIFRPMIRLASVSDSTFAPYIPSVESRIEAVESGLTDVNSNLSSLYYKVGDTISFSSGNGITVPGFLQKTANSISTIYAIIPMDKPVTASNYTMTIGACYVNYSGSAVIQCTVDSVSYAGKQIGSLLVGIDVSEINVPINSAITITLFGSITFTAS